MARQREYDPLDAIPHPKFVRERLDRSIALTERLRALLELAEKVHLSLTTANTLTTPPGREAVPRG